MQCPDCNTALSTRATSCGCGWKKSQPTTPAAPPPPCLCFRCTNDATLRRKLNGRWENICRTCDVALRKDEADAYCRERGITSPAQAQRWLQENKLQVKHGPTITREPGCDDE